MNGITSEQLSAAQQLYDASNSATPAQGIIIATDDQIMKYGFSSERQAMFPGANFFGGVEAPLFTPRLSEYLTNLGRKPGVALVKTGYVPAIVRNGLDIGLNSDQGDLELIADFTRSHPGIAMLALGNEAYIVSRGEAYELSEENFPSPELVA